MEYAYKQCDLNLAYSTYFSSLESNLFVIRHPNDMCVHIHNNATIPMTMLITIKHIPSFVRKVHKIVFDCWTYWPVAVHMNVKNSTIYYAESLKWKPILWCVLKAGTWKKHRRRLCVSKRRNHFMKSNRCRNDFFSCLVWPKKKLY